MSAVLREVGRAEDLTGYPDRDMLIAMWPEVHRLERRAPIIQPYAEPSRD
jgi:hypothetical protein